MKFKSGLLAGLFLLLMAVMGGGLKASVPGLWLLPPGGEAQILSLDTEVRISNLPDCRAMALGPMGVVMLVSENGRLLLLEHDRLRALDGSLPEDSWPEAIAAYGGDWLVLHRHGSELLRLGRRGETLGRIQLPLGRWRKMAVGRSGRIWLADSSGEQFIALGPGGQTLLDWRTARILPGFSGQVDDWCPDGEGGLILAERSRVRRINAAGNVAGSWKLLEFTAPLQLVSLEEGNILALETGQGLSEPTYRRASALFFLGPEGRKILRAIGMPVWRP